MKKLLTTMLVATISLFALSLPTYAYGRGGPDCGPPVGPPTHGIRRIEVATDHQSRRVRLRQDLGSLRSAGRSSRNGGERGG